MSNDPSNFTHGHLTTVFIYGVEEGILQAVFLGIIAIFGVLGNLYICSVIYRNKNLRNPTFIFLLNLAIANVGALTLCSPFAFINSIRRRFTMQQHWCIINGFLNNFFFCISIFTLSLIAVQNYFSIVKQPSCEWLQITKKRAKLYLLGLWCLCFAFSLLSLGPFEDWSYVVFNPTTAHCGIAFPDTFSDKLKLSFLALIAFIIPVCSMSFAYCRIYFKVSSHEGRINQNAKRRGNQLSAVSRKLAVTLCLMFSTFLICWLPFFILIALAIISNDASNLPWFLGRIAYWSGYLNCAINPSLYCLRSSAFKDVIRRRSSTSGEISITPFVRHQRAFSLPAISVSFKRPVLKRMERQSYPNVGRGGSMQDLPISAELDVARLRAYSCSSYEIKDKEKTQTNHESVEMYRGRKISTSGVKFTNGISGSWHVYETEDIRDLSANKQSAEIGSQPNINKEDTNTSI